MKVLQKYILSLFMILNAAQLCAMDLEGLQTSNLQSVVIKHTAKKSEQPGLESKQALFQKKYKTTARWKRNEKLTSLLLDQPWCADNVLEMLVGSVKHDQDEKQKIEARKPYFDCSVDRKIRLWMLIDQQCNVIADAVQDNNSEQFEESYRLLDVYTSIFILSKAPKSSDFIKNYKDWIGFTILDNAVLFGNVEVTKLLLDRGVNVNAQDDVVRTALHYAVLHEDLKMVKLLLDHGANIDIHDKYGLMPEDLTDNLQIKSLFVQARWDRDPLSSILEQKNCSIM